MSTWRVERHYGFGAAQIAIQPEPHRAARISFAEGVGYLVGELTEGGPLETLRRTAGEASALLLTFLIGVAIVITLTRDHSDESAIEVVLMQTVVSQPAPVIEEPMPLPVEIAKPEPPKPIAPKPPPQRVAEKPRPRPAPPPPVAKPKMKARPKPVIPQIAKIEAPKPPPVQRIDRDLRERPQPVARPRVAMDVAKLESSPAPDPPRMDRAARAPTQRPNPTRSTPRLNAPAAPALDRLSEAPRERAFRVAAAKPRVGERPRALPGIAPAPRQLEAPATSASPARTRSTGPRPLPSRHAQRPAPAVPVAPLPLAQDAQAAMPERGARRAPDSPIRKAPRPSAQLARVATAQAAPAPDLGSRARRSVPEPSRGTQADRPGVAGVPLGELAACLNDRDEDRLKQAVVAAVTTQEECVSSKGTYRFVETKNLNAFLMWIDRAPSRPVSDRCEELGYALECLENAGRRAAR